jgi:hypothetical protein
MTAFAQMLNLSTVVKVDAMTAHASAPDGVTATGEGQDYVLFLKQFTTATLFLKEDAV